MALSHCLLLAAFAGVTLAFAGEYIPKSFYVIDHNGHKSDVVFIRNRRDLYQLPLLRVRRGGGSGAYSSASSSAQASSYGDGYSSSSGNSDSYGDFIPDFVNEGLANIASNIPTGFSGGGGKAGAQSFASASSSSSSGGGGGGYGNQGYSGGLGAGHNVGYDGPILFSRFGEAEGSGIQVSGAAQGPKAAFSSSSSSSDGGKVKYSVQSGKY